MLSVYCSHMELREILNETGNALDGDEMTGRQAAIFIGLWMLVTALFGLVMYVIVFGIMGY